MWLKGWKQTAALGLGCAVAACSQVMGSSDEFYLVCEGTKTIEAKMDRAVEPYQQTFFLSDAKDEMKVGDELGISVCGTESERTLWKFTQNEISCYYSTEMDEFYTEHIVDLNRSSGQLSLTNEQYHKNDALGTITVQASCSKQSNKPENKI